MSKYSLTISNHIPHSTKIQVYELCKNGDSLFEKFYEEIESDDILYSQLASALSFVESSANLQTLPKTKFRVLKTPKDVKAKVYEAKKEIIRIYLFQLKGEGRVIILGSKKNDQNQDIKTVCKIVKEYLNGK